MNSRLVIDLPTFQDTLYAPTASQTVQEERTAGQLKMEPIGRP